MESGCEKPRGGLQIKRRLNETVHVFVGENEVEFEIIKITRTQITVRVRAPVEAEIRRGEQLEKD